MIHLGFAGLWDTDFGKLELLVQGTHVTGIYGSSGGRVDGIVGGNVLRGTWRQNAAGGFGMSAGTFTLALSTDGRSFRGHWTYGDDFAPGGGSWNGMRLSS